MDLKAILANEAGDSSASKQATPVTPVQAHPQQGFHREYSHPQASPGKHHPSQDYNAQPGGPYPSPTTYQVNYQGRPPPPPPIQAPPQNDLRSPARSYSAQSPFQNTPSSSASQYPFPPTHQTPQSPAQYQHFPPPPQQHRESYSQVNPPPHLQHHNSYKQASPVPQTPPIGIPGAPHPILQHQRSQSSLSNSTPTSAHSQQHYFSNQFPQDSPVSTTTPFPPSHIVQHQHQRQQSQHSQQSQPGTPLGPPLIQRQSSGPFGQPPSPYQQRGLPPGQAQGQSQQYFQFQQNSPAQSAPPSIPRQPSTPSAQDPHSQRTSTSEQHRRSQSERERSLSVSPKSQVPSQLRGNFIPPQMENGYNSAKRKAEDRDQAVEEPRHVGEYQPVQQMNGISKAVSASPQQPPKKRIRYTEPPIWARSVRSKAGAMSTVKVNTGNSNTKINGKLPMAVYPARQTPPPLKTVLNGDDHDQAPATVGSKRHPSALLGPWEESISGNKPYDEISKCVADFLFVTVVMRGDHGELRSRGVEIEIEAKLGQIIDKDTGERFRLPIRSECVLQPSHGLTFRSSMTEYQHSKLNTFLNEKVKDTHPNNHQSKKRVKIDYLHRRERDSFYELPPSMLNQLPAALRQQLNPRHKPKVRVSQDQKTGEVLASIVKCRIDDLDIAMPTQFLDCRISINFEMKLDIDVADLIANSGPERGPDRNKDRLSYNQSHYQIDLTQVTQLMNNNTIKEHELEIELSTAAVLDQGTKAYQKVDNEYLALVEGLVNNVRVLAGATPEPEKPA